MNQPDHNNGDGTDKSVFHQAEQPNCQNLPLGLNWPASRLTSSDMAKLTRLRNQTRRPITQLLHEAVEFLWNSTVAEPSGTTRNDETESSDGVIGE